MSNAQLDHIPGLGGSQTLGRILDWTASEPVPPDLILARQALDRRRFADAERHLQRALDTSPDCAEIRSLMGLLHERLGEHHAAYHCYRLALALDPRDKLAGQGLHRYCDRFGYELGNQAINPVGNAFL